MPKIPFMAEAATLDPRAITSLLSPLLGAEPFSFAPSLELPEERGRAELESTIRRELTRLVALMDTEEERQRQSANYAEQLVELVRASAPFPQLANTWTDTIEELARRERNNTRLIKRARRPMERFHSLVARFAPAWRAEGASLIARFDELSARWQETISEARWRLMIHQAEVDKTNRGPVFRDPAELRRYLARAH